jgi:murein DD-endopeptidase MepM/ murein hydrolase activator NlpD
VAGTTAAVTAPSRVALASRAELTRALRALDVAAPPRTAHASRSEHRAPLHSWVRPNAGPLTSSFGYRWGRLHAGIDLAGPYGSPILAATDGCITYAGPMEGYGEVLEMTDRDGTQTVYGHMSAFVRRSGCVKAGTVIARVGAAGDATGPHLHFEVHVGGQPVDPIPFLARHGVRI